jgi:resuscitation-promoting factor RpfB
VIGGGPEPAGATSGVAYNDFVRYLTSVVVGCLVLVGCQAPKAARAIVLDGARVQELIASPATVQAALDEAGVTVGPADRILLRGYPVPVTQALGDGFSGTIQVQRAIHVSINGRQVETTARTVGEALAQSGAELYAADSLQPPADTALIDGMKIGLSPSRPIMLAVDGAQFPMRSAAAKTGVALADGGMPDVDLDITQPTDDQPMSQSGNISVTRVSEAVVLDQTSMPFDTTFQDSPDVPLGQEQVLKPGSPGLSVTRTRVRYENGAETARNSETAAVVNTPQNRIVARGTKIVNQTLNINGAAIEYWLETQMYATVYSPCESASGGCSYGTASGRRAGKGVVAVDPALYAYLNGQRLYIPGYGYAVIGDIGGGYIVEQRTGISRYKWIDLGFDDGSIQDMSGWITVYFLAPAPATIPDALK